MRIRLHRAHLERLLSWLSAQKVLIMLDEKNKLQRLCAEQSRQLSALRHDNDWLAGRLDIAKVCGPNSSVPLGSHVPEST